MPDDEAGDGGTDRHIDIETIPPLSLDEALSIVGEETRANILVALGEARTPDPATPNALGFSELMERVGVEDSGRFNYHLEKLVGTFVRKGEAGYRLRLPGQLVYEAFVAGTLTDRRTVEPFPVGDCPDCDGRLSAAYHPDHLVTVECTGCETLFDAMHVPARGLEGRSRAALLEAAYQRRHHKVATMRRGVCQGCGGVVERSLQPSASLTYGSGSTDEMGNLAVYAVLACEACNTSLVGHPTNVALTAPVVVGFFADHGRDVARARWWEDPVAAARDGIEIVEGEKDREGGEAGDDSEDGEDEDDSEDGKDGARSVAIPFDIDGDRLRIVLDDDLQVVDSERTDGGAGG